jgi:hypothetical protein
MSSIRIHSFRAAAALFALACAATLNAQSFTFEPIAPRIVCPGLEGSGGAYSAVAEGFDTLSTNPAALAFVDREWSFTRLACEVSGPLFDIPSVFEADDMTTGILDLVKENNGVFIGANMTGPIAFGKVERNFGFGVFNRSMTNVNVPSITKAKLIAGEELLFVGGYGLVLYEKGPHTVSGGLQLKGFFQSFVYEDDTAIQVLNTFTNFDTNGIPAVLSTGFGLDVGAIYRYDKRLSASLSCKDLYTPVFSTRYANYGDFLKGDPDSDTDYDRLTPNLTVGTAYEIPLPEHWTTITRWNLMFDWRDALSVFRIIHRNTILNFAVGSEVELLDIVYLRAGIRDAYLSAGLGLDLSAFKIDFAMYGTELGLEPGDRPLLNIALSTAFQY